MSFPATIPATTGTGKRKRDCTGTSSRDPDDGKPSEKKARGRAVHSLTCEQIKIVSTAQPPMGELGSNPDADETCRLICVMAAAGSGKTTTINHTITRLVALGHRSINYVVFNKRNAIEAHGKMYNANLSKGATVSCSTADALALRTLQMYETNLFNVVYSPLSTMDVHRLIKSQYEVDINAFLGNLDYPGAPDHNRCVDKCADGIRRHLLSFLQSDLRDRTCYAQGIPEADTPCDMCRLHRDRSTSGFSEANAGPDQCLSLPVCHNDAFSVQYHGLWKSDKRGDEFSRIRPFFYYPLRMWHERHEVSEKILRAPSNLTDNINEARRWYALMARRAWFDLFAKASRMTHSTVMKRVQLNQYSMSANVTCLLIDESQDLNPAKTDWFVRQCLNRQTYFVGDSMQMIYGFTGSESRTLMSLEHIFTSMLGTTCQNGNYFSSYDLTRSFRFPDNIARVANLIIMAKYFSNQRQTFHRYTVHGRNDSNLGPCSVSYDDPLHAQNSDNTFPRVQGGLTVLARKNRTIVSEILDLALRDSTVKIAVNGGSQHSQVIKSMQDRIAPLYAVYTGTSASIPTSSDGEFLEWEGINDLTWYTVMNDVNNGIGQRYRLTCQVIEKYGVQTETDYVGSSLEQNIGALNNRINYKNAHGADVIFSTVHVAKGLEWNNVQVLGDFGSKQFTSRIVDRDANATWQDHLPWNSPGFEWGLGSQESETNLLYVAVTRAKQRLFIPTKSNLMGLHVGALVRTMDTISRVGQEQEQYSADYPESEVHKHARLLAAATMHLPDTLRAPDYFISLLKQAECIRYHMLLGGIHSTDKVILPDVE